MKPVHLFGAILFYFVGFYFLGTFFAYREKIVAKNSLPIFIKRILFLGMSNKFTLNTIVYQIALIVFTIATLVICYFNVLIDKYFAYSLYMKCIIALLMIEFIFIIRVNIIEGKRGRKK